MSLWGHYLVVLVGGMPTIFPSGGMTVPGTIFSFGGGNVPVSGMYIGSGGNPISGIPIGGTSFPNFGLTFGGAYTPSSYSQPSLGPTLGGSNNVTGSAVQGGPQGPAVTSSNSITSLLFFLKSPRSVQAY